MDLVAEMLSTHLLRRHACEVTVSRLRPKMRRRFSRQYVYAGRNFNADRFLNRFWEYPRFLHQTRDHFDLFHVVDHSYAQLVHHLPPERTVVTCHDLDTFRCLLDPAAESRSRPFRMMTRRVLAGFRKAARVTCDSVCTRDELLSHGLLPPERVTVVHNGVSPVYSPHPEPVADNEAERLLGPPDKESVNILHVGSTIPRKRIDVLLDVFAEVRKEFPQARLIRVGGGFSAAQLRAVNDLGLGNSIIVLPFLSESLLASVYRRATLLLQTSEREGFGLPVLEAMACGTPVVASDLLVLREVGGSAVPYCAVGNVAAWKAKVVSLVKERQGNSQHWTERQKACVSQAGKFTWSEYARKMVAIYKEIL